MKSIRLSFFIGLCLLLSNSLNAQTTNLNLDDLIEEDLTPVQSMTLSRAPEMSNELSLESLLDQETVAPAKKWLVVLDSEFYSSQADQINDKSKAKLTSAHSLYYRYEINPQTLVRASLEFDMNSVPDKNERAKNARDVVEEGKVFEGVYLVDPFVALKNIFPDFLGSSGLRLESRFYAPVSEVSQFIKQDGRFRFDIAASWVVGRWDVGFYLNPRYTMLREDQDILSMREYLTISYNMSDRFSAYTWLGQRQNSTANNHWHANQIINCFELGANYTVMKHWGVFAYVTNMFTQGQDKIYLFNASKNEFTLGSTLTY